MCCLRQILATVGVTCVVMLAGCTPPGGGSTAVVVIDLDAVARALGRHDVIAQRINEANQQLAGELGQVARNLQEQVQARREGYAVIGDEAEQELQQLTTEANQRLQQTQQLAQQRAAEFREAVIQEFRNEVTPHARALAAKRGAAVIVTAAMPPVLWFDPDVDITDEVIAEMRRAALEPAPQPVAPEADAPAVTSETAPAEPIATDEN